MKTLSPELDKIELDQISMLVTHIERVFKDYYDTEIGVNEWDSIRIQEEFSSLFSPREFTRLLQTEIGRGIVIGAWINEFVLGRIGEEL